MAPVDYISFARAAFPDQPPYQWSIFTDAPLTPLVKPLSQCRVALISSGGVYLEGQEPFNPVKNDLTFRRINRDADMSRIRVSHNSYDHTGVNQDTNCVFPLERLRELAMAGEIGGVAPTHYTFMGACFKRREFISELAPQIVLGLQQDEVDLCYLVPA